MEADSVSRLVGRRARPDGPEDEGQLTGAIRAKPHALLLLDEVEKAHPRVLDVFLQLFDEGRLVDSKGRTADGRHLVVVMTSCPAEATLRPGAGPGLLARADEIVTFRALDAEDVEMVVGRALAEIFGGGRRHGVSAGDARSGPVRRPAGRRRRPGARGARAPSSGSCRPAERPRPHRQADARHPRGPPSTTRAGSTCCRSAEGGAPSGLGFFSRTAGAAPSWRGRPRPSLRVIRGRSAGRASFRTAGSRPRRSRPALGEAGSARGG